MKIIVVFVCSLLFLSLSVKGQTDTVFNQTDPHNLRQGYWRKLYPNGKLMYKGYFKDNKPVGEMRRYYEDGNLKVIFNYSPDGAYANAQFFYEDGQLAAKGLYYNSLKDSTWIYYSYYDRTITSKESYVKGVRNGTVLNYYNNGNISEKQDWKNGLKEGAWEEYFADKTLKLKGNYVNGKLQGEFLVNFDDGKPYVKGHYIDDERDGKWTFYKEDGSVDMELVYVKGKIQNEAQLDERQQQLFRMIDENQGKINEPDETNFNQPVGK